MIINSPETPFKEIHDFMILVSYILNWNVFPSETLQRFKAAMQKTNKAKEELQDQSSYIDLPEMKNKRKECQEAEKQLMEIEQKLGEDKHCMTPD